MLAGVGPVPAVLLVVAADEGWMPQSAEHLDACAALGVRDGLLVITRSDLMEPEPALAEAREHLAGTPLAELPAVCVSAVTGAGLDELRTAIAALADRLPAPDPAADVRLWVDRAFTIRGAGTVVTGTLGAGRLRVDDELELPPPMPVSGAVAGARAAVARRAGRRRCAGGAGRAEPARRCPGRRWPAATCCSPPAAWLTADLVDVRLHGVRQRGPDPATRRLPEQLSLHIGAAAVPVRVRPLGPDTARLRLARPLPLRIGDRARAARSGPAPGRGRGDRPRRPAAAAAPPRRGRRRAERADRHARAAGRGGRAGPARRRPRAPI